MGGLNTDLSDSVKFAHPENLRAGARMGRISLTQVELQSILCSNTQIFVTMSTGVGRESLNDTIKFVDPAVLILVQESGTYLLYTSRIMVNQSINKSINGQAVERPQHVLCLATDRCVRVCV